MTIKEGARAVAGVVQDAGGRIVGRTRLQKIAYLLTAAGLEDRFSFEYKHYGPYSEDLTQSSGVAKLLGLVSEVSHSTQWGGTYSTFSISPGVATESDVPARTTLARLAADADAVELELAATAVFLSIDGFPDPWAETARRKPEKVSDGRLDKAKKLLGKLKQVETPTALPDI
jgi:uncharacterized protein YwgA